MSSFIFDWPSRFGLMVQFVWIRSNGMHEMCSQSTAWLKWSMINEMYVQHYRHDPSQKAGTSCPEKVKGPSQPFFKTPLFKAFVPKWNLCLIRSIHYFFKSLNSTKLFTFVLVEKLDCGSHRAGNISSNWLQFLSHGVTGDVVWCQVFNSGL